MQSTDNPAFKAPTDEELKANYITMLERLTERVRSGEVVLRSVNMSRDYERVYDNTTQKWEYFSTKPYTYGFIVEVPGYAEQEKQRMAKYLEEHPRAEIVAEEGQTK